MKSNRDMIILAILIIVGLIVIPLLNTFSGEQAKDTEAEMHLECINSQCIEIDGEGINQCEIDEDCLDLEMEDI